VMLVSDFSDSAVAGLADWLQMLNAEDPVLPYNRCSLTPKYYNICY